MATALLGSSAAGLHSLVARLLGLPTRTTTPHGPAHTLCPLSEPDPPTAAGIPTDHVLPDDPTCRPLIQRYAADQAAFFADFAAAYDKMASLGARWA